MAFWKLSKLRDKTNAEGETADVEEFETPWRNVNWDRKSALVDELTDFPLSNPKVKYLRLLIYGPIGAGKSNFVNSVNSAFQNRVTSKAIMATSSDTSCTKAYRGYKIKNEASGTFPFMFYDTMGLEIGEMDGILPGDVNSALRGHLPDGYRFNRQSRLTPEDQGYISDPPMEEKTHCLVCVVSGNSISQMSNEIISKMKQSIRKAAELGITQVVIMTMIDKICPLVKNNVRKVYMSKKIKKKMEECSDNLSIPMTCIFPVKNYHEETETDDNTDVLLLSAMKHILHFANDFTEEI